MIWVIFFSLEPGWWQFTWRDYLQKKPATLPGNETHFITCLYGNRSKLVVSFFCLKLKNLITTDPNEVYIGPEMVYGYIICRYKYWNGFRLFSAFLLSLSVLNVRGATAGYILEEPQCQVKINRVILTVTCHNYQFTNCVS